MPQSHRPAGAREVAFDEHAHRPSRTRHAQLGAQTARCRGIDRARFLSRSRDPNGDRGGDELSSVPRALSVWTATIRAWPPSLKADSVPGMRIEPGNSPAVTTAAGKSGVGSAAVRLAAAVGWSLSPDRGCGCRRCRCFGLPSFLRTRVRTFDPLLQRRQCSPLLLDDSSLAIECRALLGKQLPQLRNRRVSIRRRLRERGTGRHEQRQRQPGCRAEHDQAASRSSPPPAPSAREVRATGRRCDARCGARSRAALAASAIGRSLRKVSYCRARATRMALLDELHGLSAHSVGRRRL